MYKGMETDFYYFFKNNDHTYSYDLIQDGFVNCSMNVSILEKKSFLIKVFILNFILSKLKLDGFLLIFQIL